MTEKGKRAGIGGGIFGGGGLIGVMALGTLSACLVAALGEAMDVRLAALIVTVVYARATDDRSYALTGPTGLQRSGVPSRGSRCAAMTRQLFRGSTDAAEFQSMDQAELFLLGVIGDAPSPLNDAELDRAWHERRDQLAGQDLRQAKRAAAVTGLIEHGTDGRWRLTGAGRRVIG